MHPAVKSYRSEGARRFTLWTVKDLSSTAVARHVIDQRRRKQRKAMPEATDRNLSCLETRVVSAGGS